VIALRSEVVFAAGRAMRFAVFVVAHAVAGALDAVVVLLLVLDPTFELTHAGQEVGVVKVLFILQHDAIVFARQTENDWLLVCVFGAIFALSVVALEQNLAQLDGNLVPPAPAQPVSPKNDFVEVLRLDHLFGDLDGAVHDGTQNATAAVLRVDVHLSDHALHFVTSDELLVFVHDRRLHAKEEVGTLGLGARVAQVGASHPFLWRRNVRKLALLHQLEPGIEVPSQFGFRLFLGKEQAAIPKGETLGLLPRFLWLQFLGEFIQVLHAGQVFSIELGEDAVPNSPLGDGIGWCHDVDSVKLSHQLLNILDGDNFDVARSLVGGNGVGAVRSLLGGNGVGVVCTVLDGNGVGAVCTVLDGNGVGVVGSLVGGNGVVVAHSIMDGNGVGVAHSMMDGNSVGSMIDGNGVGSMIDGKGVGVAHSMMDGNSVGSMIDGNGVGVAHSMMDGNGIGVACGILDGNGVGVACTILDGNGIISVVRSHFATTSNLDQACRGLKLA